MTNTYRCGRCGMVEREPHLGEADCLKALIDQANRLHGENAVLRTEILSLKRQCSETGETQAGVYGAVQARGYMAGLTRGEFAARQVAKLVEEVAELARCFSAPPGFSDYIAMAGTAARVVFDNREAWSNLGPQDGHDLAGEIADVQVVLYCLAESLNLDSEALAASKAARDIARGVR